MDGLCDLFYSMVEGSFIFFGRCGRIVDFVDELECCVVDFLIGCWWFEIKKGMDVLVYEWFFLFEFVFFCRVG